MFLRTLFPFNEKTADSGGVHTEDDFWSDLTVEGGRGEWDSLSWRLVICDIGIFVTQEIKVAMITMYDDWCYQTHFLHFDCKDNKEEMVFLKLPWSHILESKVIIYQHKCYHSNK